jgi:hypothetical protein
MGRIKKVLLVSLSLFLFIVLLSGSAKGASCESCHSPSSSRPSGGWVYHPPVISIISDPFYFPDTEFTVKLVITDASDYEVRSISAEISLSNDGLTLISEAAGETGTNNKGEPFVEWTLRTGTEGKTDIIVDLEYVVYYKHRIAGNADTATYFERITDTIITADLDLRVSPGTIFFEEEGAIQELVLTASKPISSIRIEPPAVLLNVLDIQMEKDELSAGENITVRIRLDNMTEIISDLSISWIEEGGQRSTTVEIVITDPGSSESNIDIFWEVGKYTGIAAFILILIGYFTGGASILKKPANRFFGSAKRRVDFHCALSFLTLILVLIHFIVLWYGPFRELILRWEVVLGEVALLIMIIVSLNGIFQRRLVKWMGFQNWKRIHAWGSGVIKVLVIVHMLLYGSHFLWFRNIIGYG